MSEPAFFSQIAIDTYGENSEEIKLTLQKLRLLPSRAKFKNQIAKWAEVAMVEIDKN